MSRSVSVTVCTRGIRLLKRRRFAMRVTGGMTAVCATTRAAIRWPSALGHRTNCLGAVSDVRNIRFGMVTEDRTEATSPLNDAMENIQRELVRRVAADD